ncbi:MULTISPECIES: DEAD/DEAH box helicase family protein [unclassified Serratia (in: enterobacteria)]|uniref:DEAD/DEAH box helicase family protein n=1 Tax=unclassified Serratia (in: enterobacteria) TaxID=2647522 RepID=UPI0030767F10
MDSGLKLHYVEAICGSGKTHQMVKRIIDSEYPYYIIATPTTRLSQSICKEFRSQGYGGNVIIINSDKATDSVYREVTIALTNALASSDKHILIITHNTLMRIASRDKHQLLAKFNIFIDELPEEYCSPKTITVHNWNKNDCEWKPWINLDESVQSIQEVTLSDGCHEHVNRFLQNAQDYDETDIYKKDGIYDFLDHLSNSGRCAYARSNGSHKTFHYSNALALLRVIRQSKSVTILANNVVESLSVSTLSKLDNVKMIKLDWGLPTHYKCGDKVTIQVMLPEEYIYTKYLGQKKSDPNSDYSSDIKKDIFEAVKHELNKNDLFKQEETALVIANKKDHKNFSGFNPITNSVHGLNCWDDRNVAIYLSTCRLKPDEENTLKYIEDTHHITGLRDAAQTQRCYEACLQSLFRISIRRSFREEISHITFFVPSYDHAEYVSRYTPNCTIKLDHAIEIKKQISNDAKNLESVIKVLTMKKSQKGIKRSEGRLPIEEICKINEIGYGTYRSSIVRHRTELQQRGLMH